MGNKPNAIIYVTRIGLAVAGKKITSAQLALPSDMVNNLEVLNMERLTAHYQQFLTEHGFRGKRVLIVLGISVIFEKTIALDKVGSPSALAKAFVSAMPFEPEQRVHVELRGENQLRIFATNLALYRPLVEAARACGAKVLAVVPAQAYNLSGNDRSFDALSQQFMRDAKTYRTVDFQDVEPK